MITKDIQKLIEEKRKDDKKIKKVYCPVLKSDVHFTSEGFNHLIYDSNRMPRNISDQYMRLRCLQYAPEVIENCESISEIRRRKKKYKGKMKDLISYELIHPVSPRMKIKVVVEKIGIYNNIYKLGSVMNKNKMKSNKKKRQKRRS